VDFDVRRRKKMIPESNNLRKIDLFRAAMLARGISVDFIDSFEGLLKSIETSPGQYEKWNSPLTADEMRVFRYFLLAPDREAFAKTALEQFVQMITNHFKVNREEFLRKSGLN
jgi:hypothetical protein